MSKVGRNDPCPCGSGKKFKFCHGESNSIPFGEDQTFMESIGKPNMATDFLREMKQSLGDQVFESIDEANAFMGTYVKTRNDAAREDFAGLSSAQIAQILNNPADECPAIAKVDYSVLDKPSPTPVPILEAARWLLAKLDHSPMKLTAAGYLPPAVVVLWWEDVLAPLRFYGPIPLAPVKKESDSFLMGELRQIFTASGWIKVRNGTLSVTKKGSQFLAASFREQYRETYHGISSTLDWSILNNPHDAPHHPMMQDAWLFNLYLLRKAGTTGVFIDDAADQWLKAFPRTLEDYSLPAGHTVESRRESVRTIVSTNCFSYFPRLLGLIDIIEVPSEPWYSAKRVRLSELAKTLHRWKI